MREITFAEALREALVMEMRRDPAVFVAGEDVAVYGGIFGVTQGLLQEFGPERVKDTPISETAIIGLAVGAAAAGLRPVVEIMFIDFMGVCMDEILNQAAKMRYMFGGKARIPMVVRTPSGAGLRAAAQHSQCLEAWFTHIPGLYVVIPSTPADAKGLLISAIRDDNPVIFIEPKQLYASTGPCPEGEYLVPLGRAEVRREGRHVTLVSWGSTVPTCLGAAERLAAEGIEAEVVDLRSLVPLDKETVLKSVAKTGRVVIVHEATRTSGFGAEVAAVVAEEGFDSLDAPVKRVTAPDTPVPFSPVLEDAYLPDEEKILAAVRNIM
ncbi:MAG: alpha-ketoacid dehydrogenase subunit beta [Desulfotomaculales bacterium]